MTKRVTYCDVRLYCGQEVTIVLCCANKSKRENRFLLQLRDGTALSQGVAFTKLCRKIW